MPPLPPVPFGTVACGAARAVLRALGAWVAGCALAVVLAGSAQAEDIELTEIRVHRAEDGVQLDFATRFGLPRPVEEALHKGVPLHFVAHAELYRYRWYWRDLRVGQASRTWRLTYQPLTLNYRVAFGALAQTYDTLADALAAMRRSTGWRIAEPLAADDDARHYVEFGFRLDTSLLPRPLQIGFGGQPEWQLAVERVVPVPPPAPAAATPAASAAPAPLASEGAR